MAKKLKKQISEDRQLRDIHTNYVKNVRAISEFVENLHPIVIEHDKISFEKTMSTITKIIDVLEENKNKTKVTNIEKLESELSDDQFNKVLRLTNELKGISLDQAELLYNSAFVLLVSRFDYLLADLLSYYLKKYPESLAEKETPLTLKDLKLFNNISDAIDFVIAREVEKLLYQNQSLLKQKNYFKSNLKIDICNEIINWARVNEAIERRHIIVHNNSKINKRYLDSVDLTFAPEKKSNLKEGNQISINKKYFKKIQDELLVTGIILTQNCWRKWNKNELETADTTLNETIYDILCEESWEIAERLGLFSKRLRVHDQEIRLFLDINYCQSLKWQGKIQTMTEELEKIDVSVLSPMYTLAVCALKDDTQGFFNTIEKAVLVDKMLEEHFLQWPLFRKLRKNPKFKTKLNLIFKKITKNDIKKK